jgi:hypothetical protein
MGWRTRLPVSRNGHAFPGNPIAIMAREETPTMLSLIRSALAGQYGAALAMLDACLGPAESAGVWHEPVGRFPFWHVAYHVIFCTDMYLSPDERSFRPPAFHQPGSNFLGPAPWAPDQKIVIDPPYDRETLSAYVAACRAKAARAVAAESEATLAGPSGFHWLHFTRLELHLYNLRHVQHHAGQLSACLRRHGAAGQGVGWVVVQRA